VGIAAEDERADAHGVVAHQLIVDLIGGTDDGGPGADAGAADAGPAWAVYLSAADGRKLVHLPPLGRQSGGKSQRSAQ